MLNGKILAAVLATLAAFGVASGGQNVKNPAGAFEMPSMDDLNPRSIGAFTGLIPEDKTRSIVQADLNYNSSQKQDIELKSRSLSVRNLTSIATGKQTISSENTIELYNFGGKLTVSEKSDISGKTGYIVSNGVNISGDFNIERQVKTDKIKAIGVTDTDMVLNEVDGQITSGSTSAELSGPSTSVSIRSYSGNITFSPQSGRISLKGEVSSLKAGDVSIG